ncbi:MAG: hypothetical protein BWX62_00947 [Bacteroidetes bacterium ADurb.Bin037]|nr:MAG: hypothetical protein BWX62_00947 [Bacteroidetes bacterium ADurb.Bin037]HPW78714.1 hypothetical protein [Bacteroidales bacterium]HQB56217.1 hypothetical protein [Bacteroidales bacterium]
MKLHELNRLLNNGDPILNELYCQFTKLLIELGKRELPDEIVISINNDIDEINSVANNGKALRKQISKGQRRIIKLLEKDLKLVPINYYRNVWTALGMAVFGIPVGVAFGTSLGNMAYLALGLPIGLAIGYGVGDAMDKKALKEGRQLDIEIKY